MPTQVSLLILRNVYLFHMILELAAQFGFVPLTTVYVSVRVKKDLWIRTQRTLSQYGYFAAAVVNELHDMSFCLRHTLMPD